MESMRLWPADKARTPREYLKLLKSDDPRRGGLLNLTRSFERVWYGGREADESTYANATKVARELIDKGTSTGGKR
jgi:streptomycin 6-kinase